jgi:hypothetical protein
VHYFPILLFSRLTRGRSKVVHNIKSLLAYFLISNSKTFALQTVRWMPSNCAYHVVVSGLGLTRLEREPWSFWKARVLELDEVRV